MLDRQRLIGFSVVLFCKPYNDIQTVRKIRPIFGTPDCAESTIDLSGIEDSYSVEIGSGFI